MDKLIFVYNADSGVWNAMKDWAHKIVSPETYACSLCALTYDNLGMRRPWREFIKELGYDVEFLHRDELAEQYGIKNERLPAAFILQNGKLKLWIKCEAMDALNSLDELQSLVTKKLAQEPI
ncbi:MAG: hypothetical protein QGD88_08945 [Anaerolineae bacterium]|nr:hypothetical protein [Anaerolineae bacterium]MDK1081592.1 hypothetical protein [Anaerolineae bacterium]